MSSSSNGWPPLNPPLSRRLRERVSQLALKLGEQLRERDSDLFKRIQREYQSIDEHGAYQDTSPTEKADVKLESIVYGDLYPIEAFPRLRSGIATLLENLGARPAPLDTRATQNWEDWLQGVQSNPNTGAWQNVGILDLSKTCHLIDRCHVWANSVGDYIALSIVASPSEKCRKQFRQITDNGGEQSFLFYFPHLTRSLGELSLFSDLRFSLGYHEEPPSADFEKQVDRLFLKCNREITDKLNDHIGGGLGTQGPLPSLEVISTALPESQSPTQLWSGEDEKRKSANEALNQNFWSCIGGVSTHPWKWSWGCLYSTDRSDKYSFRSYQMLVHRPNLADYGDYVVGSVRDDESVSDVQLRGYFSFMGKRIGALLAIREQFFRFRKRLIRLRNQVSPQLGSELGTIRQIWRTLRKGTSQLTEINSIRFSQGRLWSAISEERKRGSLYRGLKGAERQRYDSDSTADFLEDWHDQLQELRASNRDRLERLESSYKALFSITNAQVTASMQLAIVILTVVLLILTAVMATNGSGREVRPKSQPPVETPSTENPAHAPPSALRERPRTSPRLFQDNRSEVYSYLRAYQVHYGRKRWSARRRPMSN